MPNYCVTGALTRAADELDSAVRNMSFRPPTGPEEKLRAKLVRLRDSVDRAEKQARKLIPGGWRPPAGAGGAA